MADWRDCVPETIRNKYELFNYNHAVEIFSQSYHQEFNEILSTLDLFYLTKADMLSGGGNESTIPKRLANYMHPIGWQELRITGDLVVKLYTRNSALLCEKTIPDFIEGHNIDFVKNRIALDMEWNSKDQTFDRDLYALRTFYECGIISGGVIITRSSELNAVFRKLGIMKKYGASTTWVGKLLPRLQARRHGGCPVFVVGITPAVIIDLEVE